MDKDDIVLLVSLITPFIGALATIIPVLRATFSNRRRLLERIDRLSIGVSRLFMHDEALPLPERIQAGEEYRSSGGNGASEQYLQILEERYKRELIESGRVE
jgi:hypothetical protein